MISLEQLISYKDDSHDIFGNSYFYVISDAENNLISKLNGKDRVAQLLSNHDNEAKALFYYQLRELSGSNEMKFEVEDCFRDIEGFDLSNIDESRLKIIKSNVEKPSSF
ncbi:MAG: hypothetical protein RR548_06500 [Carnobacterium sp.]|uniref:hypothetical protein n=1 Tax=unclassified Carnobacterium TaxID=257487 RepID=UPI0019147972|nr:hypothetical protein [Carnobacterium sp. CS13]QQP70975.1 hypothetical protein JHE06_04140 [Carnobacterium sp. CS13]